MLQKWVTQHLAEIMQNVVNLYFALCLRGASASSPVTFSVVRGVILANDRPVLLENGGHIDLNIDWPRQELYQFDTIRRMATAAKILIAPALLNETKFEFQKKIKEMQAWHKIPEDSINNFDQTPLPYICTRNRTYVKKGFSNVLLAC